ncbi:MAG: AtpZ/AtpI family protein [Pseudomonadota bacterium]
MNNDEDLNARRKRLRQTLADRDAEREAAAAPKSTMTGYGTALRMSSEFVSAIFVGCMFGFGLDWLLGTTPWFLIVFLLLGFVAGILNVLRSAGLIKSPQVGKRPPEREEDPSH